MTSQNAASSGARTSAVPRRRASTGFPADIVLHAGRPRVVTGRPSGGTWDLNRRWGAVRAVRIRPSGARVHRNGGGSRGRGGGGGVGPAISRKIIWRAPGSYGQGLADQTSRHTGPKSNGTGRDQLSPPRRLDGEARGQRCAGRRAAAAERTRRPRRRPATSQGRRSGISLVSQVMSRFVAGVRVAPRHDRDHGPADERPERYGGLDVMPIAGTWRGGSAERIGRTWTRGAATTLVEIPLADAEDVNEAYRLAHEAQPPWAAQPPAARAEVLRPPRRSSRRAGARSSTGSFRESGGTVAKGELEWAWCDRSCTRPPSMAHHVEGRIMPSDVPGKESRVYRRPVGVVAVISPWNFPLQLSATPSPRRSRSATPSSSNRRRHAGHRRAAPRARSSRTRDCRPASSTC